MRLVLGVDEAGYGPNLGPLVIAVSAWGGAELCPAFFRVDFRGQALRETPLVRARSTSTGGSIAR